MIHRTGKTIRPFVRSFTQSRVAQDVNPMTALNNQWYNAVVSGLSLDPQTFQFMQGVKFPATSDKIWEIVDGIPPKSVTQVANSQALNTLSGNYGLIINNLEASTTAGKDFQYQMGDDYADWKAYFGTQSIAGNLNATWLTDTFNAWAIVNAPSKLGLSVLLVQSILTNVVSDATTRYLAAKNKYAYTVTVDQLRQALNGSRKTTITLDSSKASKDVSHTWAGGSTKVIFDIFSFGGGGSWDKYSEKAISESLNLEVTFQNWAKVTFGPVSQAGSSNSPWFSPSAFNLARSSDDNRVWKAGGVGYDNFFGPNGTTLRQTSSLIVIDGIDTKITSHASYSTKEQQDIKAQGKAGFWPFFSVSGSGGSENSVTFDNQGRMTMTTSVKVGNPEILGIEVVPTTNK